MAIATTAEIVEIVEAARITVNAPETSRLAPTLVVNRVHAPQVDPTHAARNVTIATTAEAIKAATAAKALAISATQSVNRRPARPSTRLARLRKTAACACPS